MINPIAVFSSWRPVTKIFFFICVASVFISFMYFTYRADLWADFLRWIFNVGMGAEK